MAYLVNHETDDREILEYDFEGGEPVRLDLQSDGRRYPRAWTLLSTTLRDCIWMSMRAPAEFQAAVPNRMVIKARPDGYVPDFAPAAAYSASLVSDRFLHLVESLEPGVHQFFEIPVVVDTAGRRVAKRFYLMNVLTRLDAVIEDQSDVHWIPVSEKSDQRVLTIKMGLGRKPRLVLRKSAIEGHHVWLGIEGKLSVDRFFSNELRGEIALLAYRP